MLSRIPLFGSCGRDTVNMSATLGNGRIETTPSRARPSESMNVTKSAARGGAVSTLASGSTWKRPMGMPTDFTNHWNKSMRSDKAAALTRSTPWRRTDR